jgi:hypothetical protein
VQDRRRDAIDLTIAIVFDHAFEGKSWKCKYSVDGDNITVVVNGTKSIACLDGMRPERLAGVLARELLVAASFRSRFRCVRPEARPATAVDRDTHVQLEPVTHA